MENTAVAMTEMTEEEIRREMYENNNVDVINGVINGTIKAKVAVPETEEVSEPVVTNEIVEDTVQNTEQEVIPEIDELERIRRHNEFLKQQADEIKRREAEEKKQLVIEREKERKRNEELEQELQRLKENQAKNTSPISPTADEDDEYASDYSRRTRQMIEELKQSIGHNATSDPRVSEFIRKFEEKEREEENKRTERKQLDEIERFQSTYSELKTSKPITEIHKEYLSFIEELASAMNLKSNVQVKKAVEDYYKDGETKKIADKYGLKGPVDYDKYRIIVDLIDLKRGVEYNPYSGREEPILDDEGNRIRYRSLDEAYRVSNYSDEINRRVIGAHKDIQRKLSEINDAPVLMTATEVSQPEQVSTIETDRQLISLDPRQYEKNPELKKAVNEAYMRLGVEPPKYRGRKF
jgi:hypothetical protein